MLKEMSKVYNEDYAIGINNLYESYGEFVDVVITSPPYAEQRKHQYGGIKAKDYPQWTLDWFDSVGKVLKDEGSIFFNIRPNIKGGEVSDYVEKTITLLRENGWILCETIIWIKPDCPPLGSTRRPRRSWEYVYWFSRSGKPNSTPKNGGKPSNRIGFENSKFEQGNKSHIHAGQNDSKIGIARVQDIIIAGTGNVEKGFSHSAMFPPDIPEYCINLTCPEDGIVLDPFMGSGTTMRQSMRMKKGFVGFDTDEVAYEEAFNSLELLSKEFSTKWNQD